MIRRSLIVLAPLLLAAGASLAAGRVERRRPAAPDGIVQIETHAGSVRVVGWSKEEVEVTGTIGDRADEIEIRGSARRTRIEVETGGYPHGGGSADLEIKVPAGSRVEVETMSASVSVSNVAGEVKVETVEGDIAVAGDAREVELEAVNGGIEVTGKVGRARVEAVNGPVTLKGAHGDLEASAVNGPLEISGGRFERVRLESVSGRVRFAGELSPGATMRVESVSGAVDLTLPENTSAEFRVTTFSGNVVNELGPPAERTGRYTPEKELTFKTGSGEARVQVNTLSGRVALRKRGKE